MFGLKQLGKGEKSSSQAEIGSKNHEVVPTQLIAELSGIRSGIVAKCLGGLAKRNLVARVAGAKCTTPDLHTTHTY